MSSFHPSELDSTATDSVASSPRSEHHPVHDMLPRVRFMCSFGGKILPRPHDNQLRYVGGDTRIVAIHRNASFAAFIAKLSKLSGIPSVTVKYQLPNEDLDALISVTTDEDLENMMEEYERVAQNQNPRAARLRLFLFNKGEDSRASSISSILDGSTNREQWFLDALNGGGPSGLERGRSEASSIVSELPDYLFGLDNLDENPPREPKLRTKSILSENVSVSDPGSPTPIVSSPFCSMPDLPPVRTKIDSPVSNVDTQPETTETVMGSQPSGYTTNPVWQYANHHYPAPPMQTMPVYYMPGPVHPTNIPVQQIQIRAPYVPQYQQSSPMAPVNYQPVGHQVYGGAMRASPSQPVEQGHGVIHEGMHQQMFYGMANGGMVPAYQQMMMSSAEDVQAAGMDAKSGRVTQPS